MMAVIAAHEDLVEARRRYMDVPSNARLLAIDEAESALVAAWNRWMWWLRAYAVAGVVLVAFAAVWFAGWVTP